MSVATLANRSFVFQRYTETIGASGEITRTWTSTGTPPVRVRGRLQPMSASESAIHQRDEGRVMYVLYTPGTPDIRTGDRLANEWDNKKLYVTGVMNTDQADEFLKIILEGRDE